MGEVVDGGYQRRLGRQFLAGECSCESCERHAAGHFPGEYAQLLADMGRQVPADVAARAADEEQEPPMRPPFAVFGVDLGKRTDHSAVALLVPDGRGGLHVRSVHRLPLAAGDGQTHYTTQSRRLAAAAGRVLDAVDGPVQVLVDGTGVGDAVMEMVGAALPDDPRISLTSVVITGGRGATHRAFRWSVSKSALIDPMTAALEQGGLSFGRFPDADVVRRELLAFRVKASSVSAGADRLEADGSGHDDTVVAVAMAVYAARRDTRVVAHHPALRRMPVRPGVQARVVSRCSWTGPYRP